MKQSENNMLFLCFNALISLTALPLFIHSLYSFSLCLALEPGSTLNAVFTNNKHHILHCLPSNRKTSNSVQNSRNHWWFANFKHDEHSDYEARLLLGNLAAILWRGSSIDVSSILHQIMMIWAGKVEMMKCLKLGRIWIVQREVTVFYAWIRIWHRFTRLIFVPCLIL